MKKKPSPIDTITAVLKVGDGYPEPQWLSSYCGISNEDAAEAIQAHKSGSDWGVLEHRTVDLPIEEVSQTNEHKTIEKKQTVRHQNKVSLHELPKGILRVVFGVLSILAAARSFGFIYGWFAKWDAPFYSFVMAAMLVGCSIALPQALVICIKEGRRVLSTLSAILIFVSVIFSMVCTSGGLYDDRSSKLFATAAKNVSMDQDKQQRSQLVDDQKRITGNKQADSRELSMLQDKIPSLAIGSYEYNRAVNRIDSLKKRVDDYDKELNRISGQLTAISNRSVAVERDDFFSFLNSVTGIRTEEIEFLSLVIVSIIVDIAGPILASLAVFL